MPHKPTGKKNGRPVAEIDRDLFENLCEICCTGEEMQHILGRDLETISKWCNRTYGDTYSVVYKKLSSNGKASVRRNQLNLSKTNATIAIWLGKQWLGQRDEPLEVNTFNGKLAELLDILSAMNKKKEIGVEEGKNVD
jgi:hypothetical protein